MVGTQFPYCDELGQPRTMMLNSGEIRKAFDLALGEPLRVAAKYISEISKIKEAFDADGADGADGAKRANVQVVVSGGTSQSETLRLQLKQMCAAHDLPEPIWTDTFDIRYE